MNNINFQLFIAIIFLTVFSLQTYAEVVRFDATRDVWVSAYPGEEDLNMGTTSKLKLKGIQEMALVDFDLSPLCGKVIECAKLYLCDVNKKNKLRKIGISTVASPWIEGKSRWNFVNVNGKGATFSYSNYKKQRWAGDGSDLTDVTMGSGNTWQHHTELQREKSMWWSVDVAPSLIQAMVGEKSYGLLVMDESGQTLANNYVFARESKHAVPYLEITFSDTKRSKPQKLDMQLFTSFENAHMEFGAVVLRIPIKADLLSFDIYINDKEVPLWRVPKPVSKGTTQEIVLDWLPPEKKVDIKIVAVDKLGQRSDPALASGYSSKSLSRITCPVYESDNETEEYKLAPPEDKTVNVWAVPDLTKIDPVSGQLLTGPNILDFNKRNPVWSKDKNEIALLGVKGEVIAFQLVVETDIKFLNELNVKISNLIKDSGEMISDAESSLYLIHYLKKGKYWYPELTIPMEDGRIAASANFMPIKNRNNQLVYIDIYIPSMIEAGVYKGEISVLKGGNIKKTLRVKLNVADLSMPSTLSFVPELNMYEGPGNAGTDMFFQAHRITHEHRTVINRVPYGQNGKPHGDMIPRISYLKNGKIKINWSDYDKRLEALFDGSAFITSKRNSIPVEKFYLPFFENWPTELSSNYKYENVQKKTRDAIVKHALNAPQLDEALTPQFKERFVQVIKEFVNHFEEKGWNKTEFQFYLNNKWHWKGASSWWNLDEPMSYDDWMSLKFFGSLFKQAIRSTPLNFVFRADISMPRWQHNWLDGILERMYVQDESFFRNSTRIRQMKREGQIDVSVYGSLNDIECSNYKTVLWCMQAFVEGADGVLSWQSLGGAKAFTTPDKNALLVDATKALGIDWVVSLRVKALRIGQQNVELMVMLEKKFGYTREQIRDLFYDFFSKREMYAQKNDNDTFYQSLEWKMDNFRKVLIAKLCVN